MKIREFEVHTKELEGTDQSKLIGGVVTKDFNKNRPIGKIIDVHKDEKGIRLKVELYKGIELNALGWLSVGWKKAKKEGKE